MNERLQQLKQRAAASNKSTQATLQRTAPKATLGGIKQAAEKRFGQRKPTKKQQPKQVKQPKKQPKPKAVSSDVLDQWKKAMEKSNIPRHRWRKLEDKISRLSGADRKEIERALFDHELFEDVYAAGEKETDVTDEYLSDLEEKLNELSDENKNLMNLIDSAISGNPEDLQMTAAIIDQIDMDVLNSLSEKVKTSMLELKQSAANYYEEVFTAVPTAKGDVLVNIGSIEFKEKFNIDLDSYEGQLQLVQTISHIADDMVAKFNSELKAEANSELSYNDNSELNSASNSKLPYNDKNNNKLD